MKFTRPQDRMIAGVCAGLAKEYGWDATTVRVVTVILAAMTASTIVPLLYLVGWVLLPDERTGRVLAQDLMGGKKQRPSGDPRLAPAPRPDAWQQQYQQRPQQQYQPAPQQQAPRDYR